jgi:hypothetical protein
MATVAGSAGNTTPTFHPDGRDSILPACAHHWDIETTPGKFSPGKCRLCGEVKDDFRNGFANDYEEYNEARKLMRTAPRSEPATVEGPVRTKSNRMSRYE